LELKKEKNNVDYVGENFFVNLSSLKFNDTGRRTLGNLMFT